VIADLHAHYPMHLHPRRAGLGRILRFSERDWKLRLQALILGIANQLGNYRSLSSGPRVTIGSMKTGGVRVALSVLYQPFEEIDLGKPYGAAPDSGYFGDLIEQLELVERDISTNHADDAVVVHSASELDGALDDGKIAFVHCVEGGFHLGATPGEVRANVAFLRSRGVFYVTLAHLFWRQIATNAPAIPFLRDDTYDRLFPQPRKGLSELGEAAVDAMLTEGILIDLSHCSPQAMAEIVALRERHERGPGMPLIATHVACRLGTQLYNLSNDQIEEIADSGGVIGLIFADHQIMDGAPKKRTKSFDDSFEMLCKHIDHICQRTDSHAHIAIGSDLDGFIKPTLAGLHDMTCMDRLQVALAGRYGRAVTEQITAGNALRVLRSCLP
jgi:microsomal dipeptidase-like Zn-dependent dipeptidase